MATSGQGQRSLGTIIVRRTVLGIALILLILIPSVALMAATGQPAATYAAMGTITGAVAVAAGGVRVGVITAITMALLAPIAIVTGLSPITGATLMALMTLVVGRMSLFGLHKAVMLVPIFLTWPMLSPIPWLPREKIDQLNQLLSTKGMSLSQALDTLQPGHSGSSGGSSGAASQAISHVLTEQRYDTAYLTWIVVFFFVGAIIPVILLPFVLRKAHLPKPATHTRGEALAYTLTITVLTAAGTYYFLDHPKEVAGSFFIATVLVLTQVGNDIAWRLVVERVLGTLAGVGVAVVATKALGSTTFVQVLGLPFPVTLYLLGVLFGTLAIIAKFSKRQWPYYVLVAPAAAFLNSFTNVGAAQLGEQRLVDNLAGTALVLIAALITLGAGRLGDRATALVTRGVSA